MKKKWCYACKTWLKIGRFSKQGLSIDNLASSCQSCRSKNAKTRHCKNTLHIAPNLLDCSHSIFVCDYSKVSHHFHSMIEEQKQMNSEMNRI